MSAINLRILVPTAGRQPAREVADAVVNVAQSLGADLIPLHIVVAGEDENTAMEGPLVLAEAARMAGVNSLPATRHGEIVSNIIQAANEFEVDLILMGASQGQIVREWLSVDVMDRCAVPVVVIPHVFENVEME